MTGTLRERLAAALTETTDTDNTTRYERADRALETLALEALRNGICGATPPESVFLGELQLLCDLPAGHTGMHETDRIIGGGRGYWPQEADS